MPQVHNPTLAEMKRMVHSLDALGLQTFAREANTLASRVEDATQGRSCCFEYSFTRIPQTALCKGVLGGGGKAAQGVGGRQMDKVKVAEVPCVDGEGNAITSDPDC